MCFFFNKCLLLFLHQRHHRLNEKPRQLVVTLERGLDIQLRDALAAHLLGLFIAELEDALSQDFKQSRQAGDAVLGEPKLGQVLFGKLLGAGGRDGQPGTCSPHLLPLFLNGGVCGGVSSSSCRGARGLLRVLVAGVVQGQCSSHGIGKVLVQAAAAKGALQARGHVVHHESVLLGAFQVALDSHKEVKPKLVHVPLNLVNSVLANGRVSKLTLEERPEVASNARVAVICAVFLILGFRRFS